MAKRHTGPRTHRLHVVGDDETASTNGLASPAAAPDDSPGLPEDLAEILGQLFEAFAVGIARARWPLDAELHASDVLGRLEATLAGEGLLSPDAADDPLGLLFAQIVQHAHGQRTPAGLAVLRALTPFADAEFREQVVAAADDLVASGVADPIWAHTIGRPAVERCWRFGDVFGSQESIHVVFAYGRRRHTLAVLVDHELGGGVKDCWVGDDPDRTWSSVRRAAEGNPAAVLAEISWPEARASLLEAVSLEPCPVAPDQVEDVARHTHLLAARLGVLSGGDERSSEHDGATRPVPPDPRTASKPAGRSSAPRKRQPREVLQIKVTLKGSKPPIWRRLEVPADITLDRLHGVLQVAFEWHGGHLHAFEAKDRVYGDPDPELGHVAERGVRLTRVAPVGEKLVYTYDFGDDWEHVILVEKMLPAQDGATYPRCTGGRRTAPPEDCGGIWGYQDLLEVLADPGHDEHDATIDWLTGMWGRTAQDLAAFDPGHFRADDVTAALAHLAR